MLARAVESDVAQLEQRRVGGAGGVEAREQGRDAVGARRGEVARLELVILVVDLLLEAGARGRLGQFVAGVDAS